MRSSLAVERSCYRRQFREHNIEELSPEGRRVQINFTVNHSTTGRPGKVSCNAFPSVMAPVTVDHRGTTTVEYVDGLRSRANADRDKGGAGA